MMFGLSDKEYHLLKDLLDPLVKSGARIYVFGSRARGDYSKYSDIDLMIEATDDLSCEISRARERFTQSSLPYKVDLVQFSDFAESYKKTYLQDRVALL